MALDIAWKMDSVENTASYQAEEIVYVGYAFTVQQVTCYEKTRRYTKSSGKF